MRILGANDRVNIGLIGWGDRGTDVFKRFLGHKVTVGYTRNAMPGFKPEEVLGPGKKIPRGTELGHVARTGSQSAVRSVPMSLSFPMVLGLFGRADDELLGNIATRLDRSLRWNAAKERFIGDAEGNAMLERAYRAPWKLPTIS
ncbi:MAG: hypothetical protein IPM66_01990 [Acidobacteriota bacterium]|nr:MAG: hypothetical protein IPM66_01990 [Acidobacteriota bacterium]